MDSINKLLTSSWLWSGQERRGRRRSSYLFLVSPSFEVSLSGPCHLTRCHCFSQGLVSPQASLLLSSGLGEVTSLWLWVAVPSLSLWLTYVLPLCNESLCEFTLLELLRVHSVSRWNLDQCIHCSTNGAWRGNATGAVLPHILLCHPPPQPWTILIALSATFALSSSNWLL